MRNSDETWNSGAFEDLFAWIQRALQRYAEDRDCGHCLRLAREGLDHLRTTPGSAPPNSAADVLREQMRRYCLDLEHGHRDWSLEGVELLLDDLRRLRALLETGEATPVVPGSGVMPLGDLLLRAPTDQGGPDPEPRPASGAGPLGSGPTVADPGPGTGDRGTLEALQRARREFQRELVELMYGRDSPRSFDRLAEVSAGIAEAVPGTGCATLFRAVQDLGQRHALATAPVSDDLKALLGRVDRQLGHCLRASGVVAAGNVQEAFVLESALLDPLLQALREALQGLPENGPHVEPGWAEAVAGHHARPPDTPPDEPVEPFEDFPAVDETRLERIRSQGQAEMARLARAFAALDGGSSPETAAADSAGADGDATLDPGFEASRARVGEVELWQQRAVEALAQAALEVQRVEQLVAACASVPAAPTPDPPAGYSGRADAMSPDLMGRLEQVSRDASAAIGNVSTALLRQRRAVEDLRDHLLLGSESQSRSP
jgi:hypothetical protein